MAFAAPANAQTCSFTQTPLDFGSLSLINDLGFNLSGSLSINCSGIAQKSIFICSHLGAGSGGVVAASNANPRYLVGASGKLNFNLFKDSSTSIIWGSSFWGLTPTPSARALTLGTNGTATATIPIWARIFTVQPGAPAGPYLSSFTGNDALVTYAYDATSCAQVGTANAVAVPVQVTANILSACRLTTTSINFGTASLLQTGVDAQGSISILCSRGTPFAIRLGGGAAAAADPQARNLRQTTGDLVTYGIYQDAVRSIPWGNQDSNDLNVASATGATQTFTAYGRVPAQTANPGTYTDTVLVEVVY